jgi:hypothetical protein
MKIRIEIDLSLEVLQERFECAASAYSWWCGLRYETETCSYPDNPIAGMEFSYWMIKGEDPVHAGNYNWYPLKQGVLQSGLLKMIAEDRLTDAMAAITDDWDANTVDLWLQYSVYGEEVFA